MRLDNLDLETSLLQVHR